MRKKKVLEEREEKERSQRKKSLREREEKENRKRVE